MRYALFCPVSFHCERSSVAPFRARLDIESLTERKSKIRKKIREVYDVVLNNHSGYV